MENILLYLTIIILSLGCKKNDNPSEPPVFEQGLLKDQTINVSGINRGYHIYVPKNPVNAPIVILLHGNGSNYNEMLGIPGNKAPYKIWLDIAQRENLIVAIPNGSLASNNRRGWNDCRNDTQTNPTSDDVLFMSQLIDFISNKYNANPLKVFVVGTSNGGHMTIRLAMEIPKKITAFAAIIASMSGNSRCQNSSIPVSALFMNGTSDPFLPFDGGQMAFNRGLVKSTEQSVAYWTIRNGISANPIEEIIPDINVDDNSNVIKYLYEDGANNTEVALFKVVNGGHTEPSISEGYSAIFLSIAGNQNRDIEMASEIWRFFKNKSK